MMPVLVPHVLASLFLILLLRPKLVHAAPSIEKRACPEVHVFGARETTAPAGYGFSTSIVNSILAAYPGSTSEAIIYLACGGQASCGHVTYAESVVEGVAAVASQVNAFNAQCPSTTLVLVGYEQGGQIFDDGLCGGGDAYVGLTSLAIPISTAAQAKIAAAILIGDPRYVYGQSYQVGTCKAQGVRIILHSLFQFRDILTF